VESEEREESEGKERKRRREEGKGRRGGVREWRKSTEGLRGNSRASKASWKAHLSLPRRIERVHLDLSFFRFFFRQSGHSSTVSPALSLDVDSAALRQASDSSHLKALEQVVQSKEFVLRERQRRERGRDAKGSGSKVDLHSETAKENDR
jgi:hypothetical protein